MSAAHAHLLSIHFLAKIISASLRMHVKIHPLHPPQQEIIADQVDTLSVCCVVLASLPTQYAPLSGSRRQEKKKKRRQNILMCTTFFSFHPRHYSPPNYLFNPSIVTPSHATTIPIVFDPIPYLSIIVSSACR